MNNTAQKNVSAALVEMIKDEAKCAQASELYC